MTKLNLAKLIAHRGASAYAPENTLKAFQLAKENGASWVEFDVTLSKDQTPVVIHDDSLERTTNGHGEVCVNSFQELTQLDAGSWFDPKYQDQKIPSLDQVLQLCADLSLAVNIEIKPPGPLREATVKQTLNSVTKIWPNNLPEPLFSSFSYATLESIRSHSKTAQLGLLLDHWDPNWQQLADGIDCVSVHLNASLLTFERVAEIKSSGRAVLSYTINDRKQAEELFAMGVDAIFSDFPDLVK